MDPPDEREILGQRPQKGQDEIPAPVLPQRAVENPDLKGVARLGPVHPNGSRHEMGADPALGLGVNLQELRKDVEPLGRQVVGFSRDGVNRDPVARIHLEGRGQRRVKISPVNRFRRSVKLVLSGHGSLLSFDGPHRQSTDNMLLDAEDQDQNREDDNGPDGGDHPPFHTTLVDQGGDHDRKGLHVASSQN